MTEASWLAAKLFLGGARRIELTVDISGTSPCAVVGTKSSDASAEERFPSPEEIVARLSVRNDIDTGDRPWFDLAAGAVAGTELA